jgi:hypothetical protein
MLPTYYQEQKRLLDSEPSPDFVRPIATARNLQILPSICKAIAFQARSIPLARVAELHN